MANPQKQKRGTKAAVVATILQAGEIGVAYTGEVYVGNKEASPGAGDKVILDKPIVAGDKVTVTASGTAMEPSVTVAHSDTSSVANVTNSGATVMQGQTYDSAGHVLTNTSKTLTATDVGAAASGHNHDAVYIKLSGGTFTGVVVLNADPSNPLEATTKQYVDGLVQGLSTKTSVRAATTANITLSGTQTVDGTTLVANDRVLVKNQTTASQNGLYDVKAGAWTRCTDSDSSTELKSGTFCFVCEGTIQADTGWVLSTDGAITIGTTSISFTQFSAAGIILAGTGLTKTGNTLSVNFGGTGTANTVSHSDHTFAGHTADLDIGSAAIGSILYKDVSGKWIALPAGDDGKVLKCSGGLPFWLADSNNIYSASYGILVDDPLKEISVDFSALGVGDNGNSYKVARADHAHSIYLTANSVIDGGIV